jgi:acyl carrier protein
VTLPELKHVIAIALNTDDVEITDDASMDTVGTWDSLRHLYVVMALEEALDVKFDDSEAVSITSLLLILASLEKHGITLS